jgi:hypothetical protein
MSDTQPEQKFTSSKTCVALVAALTILLMLGLGGALAERSWTYAAVSCGLWCAGMVALAIIGMVVDRKPKS